MSLPEAVRGALRRTLAERREEYLARLTDLVARDTRVLDHGVGGGREAAGQEYLEELLTRMGARVEREPLEEEAIREGMRLHGEGNPGHDLTDRWNLSALFPGGNGPSLLFDGHVDTMPPDGWTRDPLTPSVEGGASTAWGPAT